MILPNKSKNIFIISFLTCKSFYGIMSVIQCDLQGQRVDFKVKFLKIIFVTNPIINKHHNLIIMYRRIHLWNYFGDSRTSSRSEKKFQDQNVKTNIIFRLKVLNVKNVNIIVRSSENKCNTYFFV